jgi:regulator of protease activity HflC (stomatin/prohibitin superfamily)
MFKESAKLLVWLIPVLLLALIVLPQAIRILREYERGVIFRLGKLLGAKGPGMIFLIPIVDRMVKMDLRVVTIDVARQEVMTRDNVPMTVDAVVYFRVVDPEAAVVRVENYLKATWLISQTTLRSVLGQAELDELLSQRDKINLRLQEIIDHQTDPLGNQSDCRGGQRRCFARQHEARDGGSGRIGAGAPRENHQRRRRVSGSGKTGAGGGDDFRATDRPATALLTDDEGNFERA